MNGTTIRTEVPYQWYTPTGIPGVDVEEQVEDLPLESSQEVGTQIAYFHCLKCLWKIRCESHISLSHKVLEVGHTTDKCTYIICHDTFACPCVQFKFGIWY